MPAVAGADTAFGYCSRWPPLSCHRPDGARLSLIRLMSTLRRILQKAGARRLQGRLGSGDWSRMKRSKIARYDVFLGIDVGKSPNCVVLLNRDCDGFLMCREVAQDEGEIGALIRDVSEAGELLVTVDQYNRLRDDRSPLRRHGRGDAFPQVLPLRVTALRAANGRFL